MNYDNDTTVSISGDTVQIFWCCEEDEQEYEIAYWSKSDWINDPDVVLLMARCIRAAKEFEAGAQEVARLLGIDLESLRD